MHASSLSPYFFPFALVTLLPPLNFGNTIDALRLLLRLFSMRALPADGRLGAALEEFWSTSMPAVVMLEGGRELAERDRGDLPSVPLLTTAGMAVAVLSTVAPISCQIRHLRTRLHNILSGASMTTSSLFLGCCASSSSFADSRCVRASSTGPNTRLLSATLFAFLVLARAPFAMAGER